MNDLISIGGCTNVSGELQQEHLVVNLENIVTWQPEIIVMWTNPRLSPDDVGQSAVWSTLPAARNNRIHEMPEVFLCDFWTLKFLYAVKLLQAWCQPSALPSSAEHIDQYRTKLLLELYGPEKGERLERVRDN